MIDLYAWLWPFYLWNFRYFFSPFWISKFLSEGTAHASVCTTKPQIRTVICCIHLHIHHMYMSRILFLILILSFVDFVVSVVRWLSCFCCSNWQITSRSWTVEILFLFLPIDLLTRTFKKWISRGLDVWYRYIFLRPFVPYFEKPVGGPTQLI